MESGSKNPKLIEKEGSRLKLNDISDQTKRDPVILLTIGRTIMANDRTLLAFLRTSLAFCAAGIGLIKYLDPPVFDVIGWIFVVLAGIFLIWGVHRYRHVKKILRVVTPEDQQSAEKEMGL
jgi:putative membrane protein